MKVKSTTDVAEEDAYEAQVTEVSCVFRGEPWAPASLPLQSSDLGDRGASLRPAGVSSRGTAVLLKGLSLQGLPTGLNCRGLAPFAVCYHPAL